MGLNTADDLLAWLDDDMRHELVAGVVVAEPLPTHRHDRVRQAIFQHVNRFVDERGLGEVFGRVGYILFRNPDTVRGPDISFVRRERVIGADWTKYFPGAPDLAVLILSESSDGADLREKLEDYLTAGCRLVWVVDSTDGSAAAYSSPEEPDVIQPDGSLEGRDVLAGLSIPLATIFKR